MNMSSHVMEMQDEIPPERLPPPVHIAGIGTAHIEITATPEAQIWFDQGLNLYHDFDVGGTPLVPPAAPPEIAPTAPPLALTHSPGVALTEGSEYEKVARKRS